MTCDDCYFSELCITRINFGMGLDSLGHDDDKIEKSCKHFKNKNLIIELPCKVGDTVYFLTGIRRNIIKSAKVKEIIFDENGIRDLFVQDEPNHMFENSFDIFFLSRENAGRALREREES